MAIVDMFQKSKAKLKQLKDNREHTPIGVCFKFDNPCPSVQVLSTAVELAGRREETLQRTNSTHAETIKLADVMTSATNSRQRSSAEERSLAILSHCT